MRYHSTRGEAPVLGFADTVLSGLARDGGLYLPQNLNKWDREQIASLSGLSYAEIMEAVIYPFVKGEISREDLRGLVNKATTAFSHSAVAPLVQLDQNHWVMELFHGPTLAFKDYALQFLGHLFEYILSRKQKRVCIVGATSGDTGSAAIEACRDRSAIDIVILHPHGRVSEVQRKQMTGVLSPNVHNIAIEGSFDDCQDIVKALFNDHGFRDQYNLSAINSINWARIIAQVAYYFVAAVALGAPKREISFAVPTGNFGNVFAGYVARQMGLPIKNLIIGSNRNDILTRFVQSGSMKIEGVEPSLSPSMDIQVSSNFERLLFLLLGEDGAKTAQLMENFRKEGEMKAPAKVMEKIRKVFAAYRYSDPETLAIIQKFHKQTGMLLDPHSAIGVEASFKRQSKEPIIALATAHPAKFPDAVEKATGIRPALPERLADLLNRQERFTILPNEVAKVRAYIQGNIPA